MPAQAQASASSSLWNIPVMPDSTIAVDKPPADDRMYATGQGSDLGASQQFADSDLYDRAISISSPRLVDDEGQDAPQTVRKKVVRRVEVPFKRKVKVPTVTTKIVPTMVEQRVPVKKLISVPSYKMVDEVYTEVEEREAVRDKEIWVKKVVPERYIERVNVQRTRKVRQPTTEVREVDDFETVQVPGTKAVQVKGFRIDEVQDSKMVEVEEFQEYEMRPVPTDRTYMHQTREVGRIPRQHIARSVGGEVYQQDHPSVRELDEDSNAGDMAPAQASAPGVARASTAGRSQRLSTASSIPMSTSQSLSGSFRPTNYREMAEVQQGAQPVQAGKFDPWATSAQSYGSTNVYNTGTYAITKGAQPSYDISGYAFPSSIRPAGAYRHPPTPGQPSDLLAAQAGLGMTVKNTHTRHTDGTGVLITRVDRGTAAARAGLQPNDIITSVAGQRTDTVDEFRAIINGTSGPLPISINRDGRRNLNLQLR